MTGPLRSCACGWLFPATAIPVRVRVSLLGEPVVVDRAEVARSRIEDAYVAMVCPSCGAPHVHHTAESAVRAGLIDRATQAAAGEILDVSGQVVDDDAHVSETSEALDVEDDP